MDRELTYDLLIHPFYSLIDHDLMSKGFSQKTALRNAKFMRKFWIEQIRLIAQRPNRGIIIIRPDYEKREQFLLHLITEETPHAKNPNRPDLLGYYSGTLSMVQTAIRLFSSLENAAVTALGRRRVIVVHDRGQMKGSILSHFSSLRPTKEIGLAMGEYYGGGDFKGCVREFSDEFEKITGRRVRPSRARSLTVREGPNSAFSRRVSQHIAKVIARAKNINKIRQRK